MTDIAAKLGPPSAGRAMLTATLRAFNTSARRARFTVSEAGNTATHYSPSASTITDLATL